MAFWRKIAVALAGAGGLLAGSATGMEVHEVAGVPASATLRLDGRGATTAVIVGGGGLWSRIVFEGGRPALRAADGYRPALALALPADGLPMSRVAVGPHDIARAWLALPTDRYAHGVLGDRLEAAALRVVDRGGRLRELRLPDDAVFEDLVPRIVALDGGPPDTVLVVRSTVRAGAALVAYRLGAGGLEERAATPAIGTPNRWLNPVGVADFDGDGRPDVALVWHPHIGGVLKIYAFDGVRFAEMGSRPGFSNHDLGSPELDVHAIGDFDGDGGADLAIRAANGTGLVVLSFARRTWREIATLTHDRRIVGPVVAADIDGDGRADLVYRLADGAVVVARRRS